MFCRSYGASRAPAMLSLVFASSLGACCPPFISTDSLPPGRVGDPYHFQLDAECWGAFWWMIGELPVGMSFDSEGTLKGTPHYAGRYLMTIGWDDVYEGEILTSVSKSFELVIVGEEEQLPDWDPLASADPVASVQQVPR